MNDNVRKKSFIFTGTTDGWRPETVVTVLQNIIFLYGIWQCKLSRKIPRFATVENNMLTVFDIRYLCLAFYLNWHHPVFLQFAGCGDTGAGAVEVDLAAGTSGTSGMVVQGSGGFGPGSVGAGKEDYKVAAKEYEKLGLLDYSMDEEGGNTAGEEDENLLNEEEGHEMDVDNPKAAPGGAEHAVEGNAQQGGKEKQGVFLTVEEKFEREMRRRRRAEKKKEEMERKQILLENAKAAKQQGREAGGRAKVDHRYYAVRSLRGARPAGRELNRQADGDRTVEKTVGHVLEDGFLGGGDERWLWNYNIHNLDTQMNISCSFNPRTGFCYTCKGEPHKATQGRDGE
jgi:hypothetical protein